MSAWTDERVERMKELWKEGASASEIAREIGGGLSRNAVIGKVKRLKLGARLSKTLLPSAAEPPLAAPSQSPPSSYLVESEPPRAKTNCTLMELDHNRCRWPLGEPGMPDFRFCGDKPSHGFPYCGLHVRAAYQPAFIRDRRLSR